MISIIIPTYNEAEHIVNLIPYLITHGEGKIEIIVADAGSTDNTMLLAQQHGGSAFLSPQKGRAAQMNFGASLAKGDIFYFVHADTLPPKSYVADIEQAIRSGFEMGRYLSKYKSNSFLLKINAFLSRLDLFEGMGGDQTLFITRNLFEKAGTFKSEMKIMEEFEFCARARKLGKYKIIKKNVLISARKYETNGWLKVQKANFTIVKMYKKGASQELMVNTYKNMLSYR